MRWRDLPSELHEDGLDTWAAIAVLGGHPDTLEDLVAAGWLVPLNASDAERFWPLGAIEAAVARAITEGWPGRGGRMPERRSPRRISDLPEGNSVIYGMQPSYEVRIEPIMVDRRGAIALCGKEANLQDLERAGWVSAIVERSGNYSYVVIELRAAVRRAQLEGWPGKGGRPGRGGLPPAQAC